MFPSHDPGGQSYGRTTKNKMKKENSQEADATNITVPVNVRQSSYLQALGLKTLLSQKFKKPVQRFWHDLLNVNSTAWPSVTLFFVLLFAVSAIVLTLSANVPPGTKCETCGQEHPIEASQLVKPSTQFIATESSKPKKESDIIINMSHEALCEFFSKALPSDLNGRHPIHGGSLAHSLVQTNPNVALLQAFRDAGGNLNQHRFSHPRS